LRATEVETEVVGTVEIFAAACTIVAVVVVFEGTRARRRT
jgi:hypothetical protein